MSLFSGYLLKTKFLILLAIIAIGNVVVFFIMSSKLSSFEKDFQVFHQVGVEVERQTLSVARDTNFVSRLTRSIMLGDNFASNIDNLEKTIRDIKKSFERMQAALPALVNVSEREKLEALITTAAKDTIAFVEDGQSRVKKLNDIERSPEVLRAAWSEYQKGATPLANKARESFKPLSDHANSFMENTRESTAKSLSDLRVLLGSVLLAVVIFSILVGWLIMRSILLPISQAVTVAQRVAEGDLTVPIHVESKDETAMLLRALASMQGSLHQLISQIGSNAQKTAVSCSDMAGALNQINQSVAGQNDATASVAAAVEQMSVSISNIHSNSSQALSANQASSDFATQSVIIIQNASDEMVRIASTVKETASVVEHVGQQSDEISSIVQVIREVAAQTNLLALNAAIEAARAGESGRGFAVVADEVRKLAEKTTGSAEEITRMITAIQESSAQAVSSIQYVVKQVETTSAYAGKARDSIERIHLNVEQSMGFAHDISSALGEQSQASNLIAQQVEGITQMSEKNTESVEHAGLAMHGLEEESRVLQAAVARFSV